MSEFSEGLGMGPDGEKQQETDAERRSRLFLEATSKLVAACMVYDNDKNPDNFKAMEAAAKKFEQARDARERED